MGSRTRMFHMARILALVFVPLSYASATETATWARWVQQHVTQLPSYAGIYARQNQQRAENESANQALYNPSIELGYEDAAEQTKTVGVSQTIDWSGKARANRQASEIRNTLAQLHTEKANATLLADALRALIFYDAAETRLTATQQQEQQLATLVALIKQRQKNGDIGEIDAHLALLSVAQAQQELAASEAQMANAKAQLQAVLALPTPLYALPRNTMQGASPFTSSTTAEAWLNNNYDFQLAEQQLALAQNDASAAYKQRHTDPTLGLYAGKEDDENLWGIEISLPLQFSNRGKLQYQQALANSDALQAQLAQAKNETLSRLNGSLQRYQQYKKYWSSWQQLSEARLANSNALLKRVWQQGEISTQNYLLALNQSLDAQLSGIDLHRAMQEAWVDWLYQSAQLNEWLYQLANQR